MKLSGPQRLAWLAALIDGEGSIMLNKRTFSEKARAIRRRSTHYRAVVSICNTDARLFVELTTQTNISRIYCHRVNGAATTLMKRQMWTWRMANDDIREWLPKIRPFLVMKGEQADLLLEALDIKDQMVPGKVGFLPVNRVLLSARLTEIYEKIRKLNTRGRVALGELDA